MHPSKTVLINAGVGEWYSTGSERLRKTLTSKGFDGDIIIWRDKWPSDEFNQNCIYNIKADAFNHAIKAGYTTIIWADSSIWAVHDTKDFVDVVRQKGYWIGGSGYNAAQTCSDACLKYFGVDRDHAEKMPDTATGLFGVNINQDVPREFIERFIQAGRDGAFHGSRKHRGQSSDRRFKFHRQDQSCATVIASLLGMKLDVFSEFVAFKWDKYDSIFRCEGM